MLDTAVIAKRGSCAVSRLVPGPKEKINVLESLGITLLETNAEYLGKAFIQELWYRHTGFQSADCRRELEIGNLCLEGSGNK